MPLLSGAQMNIPGLGETKFDNGYGCYSSEQISIPVLKGVKCRILVEGYEEDTEKEDFHVAIANFLSIPHAVLVASESCIFRYYQAVSSYWASRNEEFVSIKSPSDIWKHIQLGTEAIVSRRPYGDHGIYVSLECNCDWEPEHGLQIVFKDGATVNKVGPYDGHLTNSDAFADKSLENVIYK